MAPRRNYSALSLEEAMQLIGSAQAQCLAEMTACRWNNRQRGRDLDVFGIVSNGQGWQFYKLTQTSDVYETGLYTVEFLPELLGALDHICAECARNVS